MCIKEREGMRKGGRLKVIEKGPDVHWDTLKNVFLFYFVACLFPNHQGGAKKKKKPVHDR